MKHKVTEYSLPPSASLSVVVAHFWTVSSSIIPAWTSRFNWKLYSYALSLYMSSEIDNLSWPQCAWICDALKRYNKCALKAETNDFTHVVEL